MLLEGQTPILTMVSTNTMDPRGLRSFATHSPDHSLCHFSFHGPVQPFVGTTFRVELGELLSAGFSTALSTLLTKIVVINM